MFQQLMEKLAAGNVSDSILNTVATMTLPFTGAEFLNLFPLVYKKGGEEVKQKVIESFKTIDRATVNDFLLNCGNKAYLGFYYDLTVIADGEDQSDTLVNILKNKNCPEDIYFRAASSPYQKVHEYLVNNQMLLQKNSVILDLLIDNSDVIVSYKEKLKEYVRFGIVKGSTQYTQEVVTDTDEEAEEQATDLTEQPLDEAVSYGDNETAVAMETDSGTVSDYVIDEKRETFEGQDEEEDELSLYQKILKLSVSQKIDRALKGTKEERTLLIRDSNKMVAMAVINSPKLTEQEAEAIAGMRNVHRDILREMGKNRNFVKKYKIVLNLVKNPKTPQDIILRLLPRLIDRDIKLIIKDKALPEFLRKNALRISKTRKKN
jgi:hypothetical protein